VTVVSTWTEVGGRRMHARVTTESPERSLPTVFVHGIGVASPYFVPTLERLAPTHRGYAVDLPGFGRSDKPDHTLTVAELADALATWMTSAELARAAVVGNSFGCQIATEFAVRNPERTTCLVLLGPTMDPRALTAARQIARWLRNSVHERPSQLPLLVRDYRAAGLRRTAQTFRYALQDRIEQRLPRIAKPALVVRGERDPIVPQRWAEEAARLLPQGRLMVVPGAGHTLNYNAPEETARILTRFLGEAAA
jgi:2-hydroxy-6-oxonona-2,4-dienedioate hydrolase